MSSSNETTETTETGSTAKAAKAPKAPKAAASKTVKAPKAETAATASKATKAPAKTAKAPKTAAGSATDAVATAAKAPKAHKAAPAAKAAKPAKAAKAAAGAEAAPACPCGTGQSLAECCGPILAGKSQAPTAEALMRSRYSAYATGDIAYLRRSLDTRWQKDFDEQATLEWSKNATWQGLSIVETKAGGPADDEGIVEFIAAFNMDGQDQKIRERAQFKKQDGVWFYVDGKVKSTQETVVSGPKVGRNDPCPCGSGKKFKKCCA